MRLFLDANILFSAAYRDGSPAELLFRLARASRCQLQSSAFAVEEARRNISAKAAPRLPNLERLLAEVFPVAGPAAADLLAAAEHGLPGKDIPILTAAARARAEWLLTGDRTHFGHLIDRVVLDVRVVTLTQGLQAVIDGQDK